MKKYIHLTKVFDIEILRKVFFGGDYFIYEKIYH